MNNRYRNVPGLRGPTKATASTLCQKCLKRDIYECSASAQERPYISRPSRTQQLHNPKLVPKLSSDVPNDLLRSNGVANELLAKREEERGRKRDLEDPDPYPSKRARSTSHSVDSVSTISTQRSLSESPPREGTGPKSSRDRVGSTSPPRSTPKKRRHSDSSSGYSTPPYSSADSRSRSRDPGYDRSIRRRHRKSSPGERGRPRHSPIDGGRQHRPRSHSMDKSRIAKSRRSMTPETRQRDNYSKRPLPPRDHSRRTSNYPERGRGSAPAQPRDPSLSPYSKRLALTQAMNLGR